MIRSMTGFGNASIQVGNKTILVEIKSVNSKFLDLNLRLPSVFREKDLELRTELNRAIESRIDADDSAAVIAELREKIPDFRRAYDDDGLTPAEFEPFAPLQRFRNKFIAGCEAVKQAVRQCRARTR